MKPGDMIEQRWKANTVLDDEKYPYVIVDNWYTEKEENAVWKELDFYSVINQKERAENTIVAKKDGVPLSKAYRFYIEDYYKEKYRHISTILNCGYKARSKEFHSIVEKCIPYYRSFASTNRDSTLISYYEENDHYKPHFDSFMWTMLIWMVKEPRHFDGGDFVLNEPGHEIKLKNNRMVLFPSCYLHSVNPIKFHTQPKEIGYGRYCITHFFYSIPAGNPEPENWNDDGTRKNA
tara:strand:- start:89 stop:793 length:705 start_codon:yes stop_codon:yes gene_type:complete